MVTTKARPLLAPYCQSYFTLQSKFPKKYLRLPRSHPGWQMISGFFLSYFCRIQDYLFERREIFKIALAARRCDATERLGTIAVMSFHDLHYLLPLQHAQMPAQVAVSQRTQLLEIAEGQSFGIADQRGEHAEPRALMNHPIQPFVGKTSFARPRFSFHRCP